MSFSGATMRGARLLKTIGYLIAGPICLGLVLFVCLARGQESAPGPAQAPAKTTAALDPLLLPALETEPATPAAKAMTKATAAPRSRSVTDAEPPLLSGGLELGDPVFMPNLTEAEPRGLIGEVVPGVVGIEDLTRLGTDLLERRDSAPITDRVQSFAPRRWPGRFAPFFGPRAEGRLLAAAPQEEASLEPTFAPALIAPSIDVQATILAPQRPSPSQTPILGGPFAGTDAPAAIHAHAMVEAADRCLPIKPRFLALGRPLMPPPVDLVSAIPPNVEQPPLPPDPEPAAPRLLRIAAEDALPLVQSEPPAQGDRLAEVRLDEEINLPVSFQPPPPARVVQVDSEESLRERQRQEVWQAWSMRRAESPRSLERHGSAPRVLQGISPRSYPVLWK
jgi:hypothetical protein